MKQLFKKLFNKNQPKNVVLTHNKENSPSIPLRFELDWDNNFVLSSDPVNSHTGWEKEELVNDKIYTPQTFLVSMLKYANGNKLNNLSRIEQNIK